MKILIVEDDESTAEAIAFHMRAAGLEPTRRRRRPGRAARPAHAAPRRGGARPDAPRRGRLAPHPPGARVGAAPADHRGHGAHQRARPRRGALAGGRRRHGQALLDARAARARHAPRCGGRRSRAPRSDRRADRRGRAEHRPRAHVGDRRRAAGRADPAGVQAALDARRGARAGALARRDLPARVGRRARATATARWTCWCAACGARSTRWAGASPTSRPSTGWATASRRPPGGSPGSSPSR